MLLSTRERSIMDRPERTHNGRLFYREHDLIPIPRDIPDLGISEGERGLVKGLDFHNGRVLALVRVDYSTGQTRGWVEMDVMPEQKVLSYSLAA
jgi:hypothetical protein